MQIDFAIPNALWKRSFKLLSDYNGNRLMNEMKTTISSVFLSGILENHHQIKVKNQPNHIEGFLMMSCTLICNVRRPLSLSNIFYLILIFLNDLLFKLLCKLRLASWSQLSKIYVLLGFHKFCVFFSCLYVVFYSVWYMLINMVVAWRFLSLSNWGPTNKEDSFYC